MKILVDENIPSVTVHELRASGHDVLDFRQTGKQGMPDPDLWAESQAQERLLVTTDKGFIERCAAPHWGVLVIRLRQPNTARIHERVMRAIQQHTPEQWPGLLVVMRDRVKTLRRSSRPDGPAPEET
jgi:predicted nuclease of predicted toxin-antitoxin system